MPDKNRVIIKNVSVCEKGSEHFAVKDILLEFDGQRRLISAIDDKIDVDGVIVDGYGLTALPGFIDLWSRMGEPDGSKRETFSTGTNSAINGGYSRVTVAPFGTPVTDRPEVLSDRMAKSARDAKCAVSFIGALSVGCAGKELCDYHTLSECGAVAFSDGMYESLPDSLLREAMSRIAEVDALIIATPRLLKCYSGGSVNLGRVSKLMGYNGIPYSAEVADVARYLIYAAETGCRLHLAGISTEQGVEAVYLAKKHGINVTASAFPCNFSFNENDILFYGSNAKVWPPLRTESDVAAVRRALIDGTLDCVSSCHIPLTEKEKSNDIELSKFGVIGLQTAFSAAGTYLFPTSKVDAHKLIELFSSAPAKILGVRKPEIAPGEISCFSLVNFDRDFIVSENYLKSRSSNEIFKGLTLRGEIHRTFID